MDQLTVTREQIEAAIHLRRPANWRQGECIAADGSMQTTCEHFSQAWSDYQLLLTQQTAEQAAA